MFVSGGNADSRAGKGVTSGKGKISGHIDTCGPTSDCFLRNYQRQSWLKFGEEVKSSKLYFWALYLW